MVTNGGSALRSRPALRRSAGDEPVQRGRLAYRVAGIGALLSFFPYAAWPVSTAFGLQVSTLLLVTALALRPQTVGLDRGLGVVALLVGPYVLSLTIGTWFGLLATPDIALKAVVTLLASVVTLLLAPILLARPHGLAVLLGAVVVAVAVHCSAAVVQLIAFRQGEFPFASMFRLNPSFASFEEIGADYAQYVARVFGLFPEPSAMSAALGPWLILLTVALRWRWAGSVPPRVLTARASRLLLWLVVAAGSVLVAASRSAYLVPYFALLAVVVLSAGSADGRQVVVRRLTAAVALAALGVYFFTAIATRGPSLDNASWTTRAQSLQFGLEAWLDSGSSAIVGVGPGQSASLVAESFQGRAAAATDGAAIYSFLLRYLSESGAVGLVAVVVVLVLAVRAMRRTAAPRLGYAVLGAWLISVGTATSYEGLLCLWLLLGCLVLWDRLFPVAPPAPSRRGP